MFVRVGLRLWRRRARVMTIRRQVQPRQFQKAGSYDACLGPHLRQCFHKEFSASLLTASCETQDLLQGTFVLLPDALHVRLVVESMRHALAMHRLRQQDGKRVKAMIILPAKLACRG